MCIIHFISRLFWNPVNPLNVFMVNFKFGQYRACKFDNFQKPLFFFLARSARKALRHLQYNNIQKLIIFLSNSFNESLSGNCHTMTAQNVVCFVKYFFFFEPNSVLVKLSCFHLFCLLNGDSVVTWGSECLPDVSCHSRCLLDGSWGCCLIS